MEVLLWIIIGLPLLVLGAYLDDRRNKRKMNSINNLIQSKLKELGYVATNAIWNDSLYVATDVQKDKVVIIRYDKKECKILNVQSIDFHTTKFLSNGEQINGDYSFVYSKNATLIYIDDNAKEILILCSDDVKNPKKIKFSDILSVELVMDSNVITKKSISNVVGRSVMGGAIAGNVGAIVGGVTASSNSQDVCKYLQLLITIRDTQNPIISIDLCNCKEGLKDVKQSDVYKQAQLLIKTFSVIIDSSSQMPKEGDKSIGDELKDLVKLKEQNILTEEEFLTLKRRLIEKG